MKNNEGMEVKSKILQVNVDDNNYGGVFSLVRSVILNKLSGFCVDIACLEPFKRKELVDELESVSCRVFYIGAGCNKVLKQVKYFSKFRKLLKSENYDCVHIHSDVAYKMFILSLVAKFEKVKKIILHSHASGIDGNNRFIKKQLHILSRYLLRYLGTHFISCSDLASKWMFPNVKMDDILILKNGVNLSDFTFSDVHRSEVRKKMGIENDVFVLGHIGRFAYQKNHDFLIRVFKLFYERNSSSKLILVGEGELYEEIRNKIRDWGLDDNVVFYGVTNNIAKVLCAFDVFLLPSHFEGLPIVGVEAQASGLYCVFSDTITRELDLTGNVVFIPTHEINEIDWVEEIEKIRFYNRINCEQLLREKGYDIKSTIKRLFDLYIS